MYVEASDVKKSYGEGGSYMQVLKGVWRRQVLPGMAVSGNARRCACIVFHCCIFLQERKVQSDGRYRRCVVCAVYGEGCTEGCCKGKSGSIYSGLCSRREYLRRYHNGNPDRYLYYVT